MSQWSNSGERRGRGSVAPVSWSRRAVPRPFLAAFREPSPPVSLSAVCRSPLASPPSGIFTKNHAKSRPCRRWRGARWGLHARLGLDGVVHLHSRTERQIIETSGLFDNFAGFSVSNVFCMEEPVQGEGKLKTFENVVCSTPTCPRKIFTERLPGLVASYGRMTRRLIALLQA